MDKILLTQLSSEFRNVIKDCIRELLNESASDSQNQKDGEFLTPDEAAVFLGVPKSTVYFLTSKKKIPFSKRGRRIYFFKQDIIQWLRAGNQPTIAERLNNRSRYLNEVNS
jgi:excisionase family DNA binding protein